jgi:hypothetical protein
MGRIPSEGAGLKEQQRKFPRVRVNKKARMAMRRSNSFARNGVLVDVSAEGVAIRLSSVDTPPARGESLTLSVHTGSTWVDIPGKVSYALEASTSEIVVGVRLFVEISGQATRQAWARWIQRLFSAARPPLALQPSV